MIGQASHRASAVTLLAILAAAASSGRAAVVEEIPVTTRSDSASMDFIAAQAAADRGDGAVANALFRSAVTADPRFTYAWYGLSTVAFSTAEFADSLEHAAAGADDASQGERLLVEINRRFLDNDFDSQLARARELVEKYPRSPRAWLALAGVQAGLNRFPEQRQSLGKAIDLDPHLAVAPFTMGNSYLFNAPRDFAQAEKYFREAIALAPGEDNYWWTLGDVFRATNRLEEAREQYLRALRLDPDDGTAPVKLGHVDSFLGRYDEARADYDRGIANADPATRPFLATYKTLTWVHAGEPATAVHALERIAADTDTSEVPQNQRTGAKVFALTNAAQISLHTGLTDDAERVIGELASVLRANARIVGTEEFSRIQEAQIAYLQGQLAARRGDYAEATRLARRNAELVAAQQNPRKMENHHDLMGLIALLERMYPEAVAHYRQADLTNMYIRYHLALALDGAGQKDEARALCREVASWNFNTAGYALVRKDARARAGGGSTGTPETLPSSS
jgi:tetratricopeptide (TPR) repeat protein